MKKIIFLASLLSTLSFKVFAAPGDTTWVQAHSEVWLDHFGNFDTLVTLPDGSVTYRKIIMEVMLGKRVCPGYNPNNAGEGPGQTGWCGDWDYTVQNFIMTPNGDTMELGRLITPYARENAPRTPLTWKQRYYFDVTDYYPVLKNSASIRLHYSGYSWGFTANIRFAFIEGTPPRNVLKVERIYKGSHQFGDDSISINTKFPVVSKTAPAGTDKAEMKFTVTGHGSDGNYCSEFCSKYFRLYTNGNMILQKDIWRNDCGSNHLYPQAGTWVYDRANWCPGDLVHPTFVELPGVTANSNFNVQAQFEDYINNGNASYTVQSDLFYFGPFNRSLDASLEDIISPNKYEGHFRENPFCGNPVITVKNTGSTTITSLKINYGVDADLFYQYDWTGSINALESKEISLPEPWQLREASGQTALKNFTAKILQVNGQDDEDITNNALTTPFQPTVLWPTRIIVRISTNAATTGGVSETSWKIYDIFGNLVTQRINCATTTTYNDTVFLAPSCYKLVVEDAGCDGLYWWANQAAGSGSISVRKLTSPLPLVLSGHFNGDFGCGFTQYFTTNWPAGVETVSNESASMDVYPNPAQQEVNITLNGMNTVNGIITVTDVIGRTVHTQSCKESQLTMLTTKWSNGMYTITYTDQATNEKIKTRLLIAK